MWANRLADTAFDAEGIHRAVLNIVTNAIDAVEGTEGGAVRVEADYDSQSDSMRVIVTDNGPGIVGHGELGRGVEEIARQFRMSVLVARRLGQDPAVEDGRTGLRELLQQSDVVSLHCPLTDKTQGSLFH